MKESIRGGRATLNEGAFIRTGHERGGEEITGRAGQDIETKKLEMGGNH